MCNLINEGLPSRQLTVWCNDHGDALQNLYLGLQSILHKGLSPSQFIWLYLMTKSSHRQGHLCLIDLSYKLVKGHVTVETIYSKNVLQY